MNLFLAGSLVVLTLGASAGAQATPVVVNGSFEGPAYGDDGVHAGGGDGWTTSFHSHNVIVSGNIQDGNDNFYGVTPYGNQYLGLDPRSHGFLSADSQTISGFVAGQAYALTLYVADSDGGDAPQLEILLSDNAGTDYVDRKVDVPVGGPYGRTIAFTEVTTTFTSTVTGDITLSLINSGDVFASPSADPGSISIDNVSIADAAATPVPEPGSAMLMLMGLCAVALRPRRGVSR